LSLAGLSLGGSLRGRSKPKYLRARYYDPDTGQFLTRDLMESLTRQAYSYAGGDPVNQFDPNGMVCQDSAVVGPAKPLVGLVNRMCRAVVDAAEWAVDHPKEVIGGGVYGTCIVVSIGTCAIVGAGGAVTTIMITAAEGGSAQDQMVNGIAFVIGTVPGARLARMPFKLTGTAERAVNAHLGVPGLAASELSLLEDEDPALPGGVTDC
jgi:RHS repeat-associated protein